MCALVTPAPPNVNFFYYAIIIFLMFLCRIRTLFRRNRRSISREESARNGSEVEWLLLCDKSFHAVFVSRQDRWRIGVSAATLKGEGTNYTVKLQNVSYRRSGVGVVLAVSSLWARGRKALLSTTTHGQYDARPTIHHDNGIATYN